MIMGMLGGEDRAEGRRGHGDAGGHLFLVPLLLHGLDLDVTEGADIGKGRAGDSRHHQVGQHVDVGQPAPHAAHHELCRLVESVRDSRGVQQASDEDEQDHRQKRERVESVAHPVGDGGQRDARNDYISDGGEAHADRQGDPQQTQEKEESYDVETAHRPPPSGWPFTV
jgi:hypothetical protein